MICKEFKVKELKELGLPDDKKLMEKTGVIIHLFERNKYSDAEKAGNSEMDLIFSMPGDNKKWKINYLIVNSIDIWNQNRELNVSAVLMEEEIITTKRWKEVENFDYSTDPFFLLEEMKKGKCGTVEFNSSISFIEGVIKAIPFILVPEYENLDDNYIEISDADSKKYSIGENDFVMLFKSSKEMILAKLTIFGGGKLVADSRYYR